MVDGFNSMVVEAHLLRDRGTESVVAMILKAGKSTSHRIYSIIGQYFGIVPGSPYYQGSGFCPFYYVSKIISLSL